MYCRHCGKENKDGAIYCSKCGKMMSPEKMEAPVAITQERNSVPVRVSSQKIPDQKKGKKKGPIIIISMFLIASITAAAAFAIRGWQTSKDTSDNNSIKTEDKNIIPEKDDNTFNDSVWEEFIASGKYTKYPEYIQCTKDYDITSLQYAIYDLNNDGKTELLMSASELPGWSTTFIFVWDSDKEVLVCDHYGYSEFRYSPDLNLVVGTPEFKPFADTGYSPFYELDGTKFEYKFQIGMDMGEMYYSDDSGEKNITAEERDEYYDDLVFFEWKSVSEQTDPVSNNVKKPSSDGMMDAYKKVLKEYEEIYAYGYTLFDLDNNGTQELIVDFGGSMGSDVFGYSNGKLIEYGGMGSDTTYYEKNNSIYAISCNVAQVDEPYATFDVLAYRIYLKNDVICTDTLYSNPSYKRKIDSDFNVKDIPEIAEILNGAKEINFTDIDDYSLLE